MKQVLTGGWYDGLHIAKAGDGEAAALHCLIRKIYGPLFHSLIDKILQLDNA